MYKDSDRHRVFDVHTRVFYSLLPLPSGKLMDSRCIVGMTVDTIRIPYGFSVFITEGSRSSTYDSSSGAWTTPTRTYVGGMAIQFFRFVRSSGEWEHRGIGMWIGIWPKSRLAK